MNKNFCILFLLFLVCSCKYRTDNFTLNESEFYIEEKTASISSDELGCIWIGTDNGDIYRYDDKKLIHYDLKEDRIYKASLHISADNDTSLWVASRNAGLQVWDIRDPQKPQKKKTYLMEAKGENYSPYDFIFLSDYIYVSTSLGFYKAQIDSPDDRLTLIYPSKENLSEYQGNIYVFKSLCLQGDSIIWGATTNGVKSYNIETKETNSLLDEKNIEHVVIYDDTLYATAKDYIYRIALPSQTVLQNNTEGQISMFFKDAKGNNFLIGDKNLLLTRDFKRYTNVKINKEIPVHSNVHNLMVRDTSEAFSFLITDNALWRIASHINIISGKDIRASCVNDEGDIYFLTSLNELYIQKRGTLGAKWIFSFNQNDPIIWMDIIGHDLYMHSSSNSFYKTKLQDEWYKNIIDNPKKLFTTSTKITATHLHKYGNKAVCYIGTQEGLFYLANDSIKNIPYFSGMYITSFFKTKNTDRIYISTLNDGVHYAGYNYFDYKLIPETSHQSFIKDIIATNDHRSNLITLTNQHILFEDVEHSIRAKGIKKLIQVNDSCFAAIPPHGLDIFTVKDNKISRKGSYYKDISFNPNACFMANDELVLGSNVGSMTVSVDDMEHPVWTVFGEVVNIETLSVISLVALFFIVLIIYIVRLYLSKETNIKDAQLMKLQEDQINRINDVQSFIGQSNDPKLKLEVSNIQSYLDTLNLNDKTQDEKKEIKLRLEEISLQIANINRKISLHLPLKIEEQKGYLSLLNNVEANELIKQIEDIKDVDNINLIYNTIKTNQIWLDKYNSLLHDIDTNIELFSNMFVYNSLNDGIYDRLVDLKKNLPIMYLSEISSTYIEIKIRIEKINSEPNKQLIRNIIQQIENRLEVDLVVDKKLAPLGVLLYTIRESVSSSHDNIELLKGLKLLDEQLQVLETLKQIKDYTSEYRKNTDRLIKENNERITKKSDSDLDSEIESKNKPIANKINNLITNLYSVLPDRDSTILSELLKVNNENSQNAKVLALLLSDKDIKRTIIPKILGILGNLNPVISRLISDRIKPNIEQIKLYRKDYDYSVFIIRVIDLVNKE